jgi:hypothetical protein
MFYQLLTGNTLNSTEFFEFRKNGLLEAIDPKLRTETLMRIRSALFYMLQKTSAQINVYILSYSIFES